MTTIQKEMRKNTLIQILAGFMLWFVISSKKPKTIKITSGDLEPVGLDYTSTFFKDSEYFGKNVIPNDYYSNWLQLAQNLDKIREGFANPIVIKKGFSMHETIFATCKAVEIYPQNNNHQRLMEVIEFLKPNLTLKTIELRSNNNIYLEL